MGKLYGDSGLLNASDAEINPATEDTVSQLVMAVTNAIDSTAYDLNSSAFSSTTSISNDYELDNVEFNFTTIASRDITITSVDGTILFKEAANTDTSVLWSPSQDIAFNGGENLTVDVTQTASACSMDCILKIKQGSNSLLGNPTVRIEDNSGTSLDLDALVESVPTTSTFHHLGHEGMVFIHSNTHSVASGANLDELIKVPASPSGRQVHLRFNYTVSDVPSDLFLYRDVVVSADGNAETICSNNDVVEKTSGVTIFEGPTITDIGNLWSTGLVAGQKNAAGSLDQLVPEFVLKAGVNYLLRLTNNNNGAVTLVTAIFFFDSEAS